MLAIGDSLTEGYLDEVMSSHPYTLRLQELFSTEIKNTSLPITNIGKSGLTTNEIKSHLKYSLQCKPRKMYKMATVLTGFNYLGNINVSGNTVFFLIKEISNAQ
jgi:lysophospholipase L1-like esterase